MSAFSYEKQIGFAGTTLVPNIERNMDRDLKDALLSESTFDMISEVLDLLSPIKGLIDVAESDKSSASTMFGSFATFASLVRLSHVTWAAEVSECISKRWVSLHHPVLSLACCLDPTDQGRSLSGLECDLGRDIEKALEMMIPQDDQAVVFSQLMQYRARTGIFESRQIWSVADSNLVDAATWW